MDIIPFLRSAIIANEVGGNLNLAYQFSDPDGIRSGKSGYSFGICQFDILNNHRAIECLQECGFSAAEIEQLKQQRVVVKPFNLKLQAAKTIVDKWDDWQLTGTVNWVKQISAAAQIMYADAEALVHACDYHNQFYMNANGKAISYLRGLKRAVTAENILKYKLTTAWGQKRPDDVHRRYDNIHRLFNRA